jgi:hypothetical protein
MTRLSTCLVALFLPLVLTATAQPEAPSSRAAYPAGCHEKHGAKFAGGPSYPGKSQSHWTKSHYSPVWKRTFYYFPSTKAWYFYDGARRDFFPASELIKPAPTGLDAPPAAGPGAPLPPPVAPAKDAGPKTDVPPAPAKQVVPPPAAVASPAPALTYETNVLPILSRSCLNCHNARTRRGGLDLSTLAALRRGGDGGPAVVPGVPSDSPLFTTVATGRMPLRGAPLSEAEKKLISDWIAAGARGR